MEETWTILKVLQWTTGYFDRKGIDQPRADAEVLVAHVLGLERIQLYIRFDQPLVAEELVRIRENVRRRAAHEPTQYITGKQEFWSLEFEVTPDVLIPRPETELLVERAAKTLTRTGTAADAMVLDIGTGSGAVAVALAHEVHDLHVIATDCSPAALRVAVRNAVRNGVADRVRFVAMNLMDALAPPPAVAFDFIVSNPPYIGDVEFAGLAPEVAGHEPTSALRGGSYDGLDLIREILRLLPNRLKPGGVALIEIGFGQAEILRAELSGNLHFEQIEFIRDYSGIQRILELRKADR